MNTCSCWPTFIWASCTARRCPKRLRIHESGRRPVVPPPIFCRVLYIISPCFITWCGHSNGMEEFHSNSGVTVVCCCGGKQDVEWTTFWLKPWRKYVCENSVLMSVWLKWILKKCNCFTEQIDIHISTCSRNVRFEFVLGRRMCLYWHCFIVLPQGFAAILLSRRSLLTPSKFFFPHFMITSSYHSKVCNFRIWSWLYSVTSHTADWG